MVCVANRAIDAAQAVVPAAAAAKLESQRPERQIDIVMHDQHEIAFVEIAHSEHGFSRAVHKGLGFEQEPIVALEQLAFEGSRCLRNACMTACAQRLREAVDCEEARVVSGVVVLIARIP